MLIHKLDKPLCFVDVETTGLDVDRHEIISFCGIKHDPNTQKRTELSLKIRVQRPHLIDPEAVKVNGYNPQDWATAIAPSEAKERIFNFLNGCLLVGHNVAFDWKFLFSFFNQLGQHPPIVYRKIDTVTLAHEHLVPCGLKSLSLDSIRSFLGIPVHPFHSARQDALDCERVYRKLIRATALNRLWWRLNNRTRVYPCQT
tara:strand:+ start:4146 stop:4745 length:600 start_codon:yes stop_codon:yes gene_type:complete